MDPDFSVERVECDDDDDDGFHPEPKATLPSAVPGSWFAPFRLRWASRVFSGASLLKNQRLMPAFVSDGFMVGSAAKAPAVVN